MKIALFFLLVLSSNVYAEQAWHTSKIKQIYPTSTGDYIITFKTPAEGCSRSDNYHYVTTNESGVTPDGSNKMLSVALTAATTGKEITVNFEKTSALCSINRLFVNF